MVKGNPLFRLGWIFWASIILAVGPTSYGKGPFETSGPGGIVGKFVETGSRDEFLKQLKASIADHSDKWYESEFPSLVTALEHEPLAPAGAAKPVERRSQAEAIDTWIYDLREGTGWVPGSIGTEAESSLVAAGPAALDSLIAALDDDTPVRELGPEAGVGLAILLRRNDLALSCIERISAITFFQRTQGRGGYFHNDPQRASVAGNVRNWWKKSKGKSQADGLRVQLGMWRLNTTMHGSYFAEPDLLFTLAELEPPGKVIDRLRGWCALDKTGLNSSITSGMLRVDPQFVLRAAFDRLDNDKLVDGDSWLLLQYGDKSVYQKLARRAQDGKLDPGGWSPGDEVEFAAEHGKNWAIPIVAAVLSKTEITGSRSNGRQSQSFSSADEAAEQFQKLTARDFGYHPEASEADRVAAIGRARDWWNGEGRAESAKLIAADHPATTDGTDLLWTDVQITAVVGRIGSPDPATARAAVAALGSVRSLQIRQALVDRVGIETDPAERVRILQKLDQPGAWQAPALASILDHDSSDDVRAAAAVALGTALDTRSGAFYWRRLETCESGMAAVRRAGKNPTSKLVRPLIILLLQSDGADDNPLIFKLAATEPARSDPEIQKRVVIRRHHAAAAAALETR